MSRTTLKRIWEALGNLSLFHWLVTTLPAISGSAYVFLRNEPKDVLAVLVICLLGSVLLLTLFAYGAAGSKRQEVERVGIRSTNSRIELDSATIENQNTSIHADDSQISARDLKIK